MSFHTQRLRQLRRSAGLDPLPDLCSRGSVAAFWWESIDPKFYSPAARHWYDEVIASVAEGGVIPASEQKAFNAVGQVLRMARDERDEDKRREFFMPSAASERDFKAMQMHRAAEVIKALLLEREMRRRGYDYGPDSDLPDDVDLPSADGLFDRTISTEYGITQGAVKQKRRRWRRKFASLVRTSP